MKIEEELSAAAPEKDMLLTIGVFDGVHLGHQRLLSHLKEEAAHQNLLSGVITFRQHPRAVLAHRPELPYLTSLSEKTRLILAKGIDKVIPISFTKELSQLSAQDFITLLKKRLKMRGLLVGPDFKLGKGREGDISTLKKLGIEMEFSVTSITPEILENEVVSSTSTRDALTDGDIKKVNRLLGRRFSLRGSVIHGFGRGAKLGFPTANLNIDTHQLLPPDGVYATCSYAGEDSYPSVTNIGKNPTFNDTNRSVETYILDFNGNLYENELRVEFIDRLRGEVKFAGIDDLKKQIGADIMKTREVLKTA